MAESKTQCKSRDSKQTREKRWNWTQKSCKMHPNSQDNEFEKISFQFQGIFFVQTYKQSKAFNNLKNDIIKDGVEILELSPGKLTIQYCFKSFEIKSDTSSKEL